MGNFGAAALTTIAYRDGVMAADTQATDYNAISRVQKLWRLPDGGVVGVCGETRRCYAGVKWLLDGEKGDPPSIEGAYLIIVRADGTIWVAEGEFPAYPVMGDAIAHGCGRDAAVMAMRLGKSAVEAVFEACGQDAMSSPPVQSLEVCPPREFPDVVTHFRQAKPKGAPSERKRRADKGRR